MSVHSQEPIQTTYPTTNLQTPQVPPVRKSDLRSQDQAVQFDQVALFQWLNRIANECDTLEKLLKGCSEVIACQTECEGLWVTQQGEDQSYSQIYSILAEPGALEWKSFQVLGRRMIKLAAGSKQIQSSTLSENHSQRLIVVPVIEKMSVETMIAGCFKQNKSNPSQNEWLMGIFAQCVSNWLSQKRLGKAEMRSRSLTDVVALTNELDRAENLQTASLIIVNQLKKLTHAQQVAFATCNRNRVSKLLAVSDLETVDHSLDATRATNLACGQSQLLKQCVIYPDRRKEANPADTLPLEQFCKSNGFDACISLPVFNRQEKVIGSILLAVAPKQVSEEGFIDYLSQLSQKIASHLEVVLKANRSLTQHLVSFAQEKLRSRVARIVKWALLGIGLVLLIPFPYKVSCNCEIQPVLRRFIAAPHDGVLEKNLVENGDVVEDGQVVANLDGRQLRIELAGLEAELKGIAKRRAAAMANNQIADSQISFSQMKQKQAEIKLINEQLKNLEIRSPIDGIIVAGDLEKVEGAPVEMGQTLFEVGPLDRMLAEIAIPEREIPYVEPGMQITIKLDAYPFKSWYGTVTKIHAKSEIKDQESVFIAEVELDNSDLNLKPGMKGRAKVVSNAYPIGWNLFHHPVERLRYWTIW